MAIIEGNADRYLNGQYFEENPDWHEDDAEWKAGHIEAMLRKAGIRIRSVCEVGCGTGKIDELLAATHPDWQVSGYEIAPQAYQRCLSRVGENLQFENGSPFDGARRFDLTMAIDVIEHVENPFAFIRSMANISEWQLFHIPLDMNALATTRGWVIMDARRKIGHLHYFTRDTALALLEECGLTIVDSFYTPWAIDQSHKSWKKRLAAMPRRVAFGLAPDITVRAVGGWSLMVLARSAVN